MKQLVIAFSLLCTSFAYGSDSWDDCSDAAGNITIERGTFSAYGNEANYENLEVLKTIIDEKEVCVSEGTNPPQEYAVENKITVEEVTYKDPYTNETAKAVLICERGYDGVPSDVNCVEE